MISNLGSFLTVKPAKVHKGRGYVMGKGGDNVGY